MTVLRLVIDPDRPLYTVQEVAGIYGVVEEALGSAVPAGDDALQGLARNRVVGARDDLGQEVVGGRAFDPGNVRQDRPFLLPAQGLAAIGAAPDDPAPLSGHSTVRGAVNGPS